MEFEVLESVDRFEPVGLDVTSADNFLGLTFFSGSTFTLGLLGRRGVFLSLLWLLLLLESMKLRIYHKVLGGMYFSSPCCMVLCEIIIINQRYPGGVRI